MYASLSVKEETRREMKTATARRPRFVCGPPDSSLSLPVTSPWVWEALVQPTHWDPPVMANLFSLLTASFLSIFPSLAIFNVI